MKDENIDLMEKIMSVAKSRGFVYPGSLIYGGLSGSFDYGPLGLRLKENITKLWWQMFMNDREDMYGLDTSIIMNPKVWEASGHVAGFADPLENGEQFNVMFKTSVGAGENAIESYLRPETAQGIFVNFKNIIDSFHPKLPFGIAQIGKSFRNEIAPREYLFRKREFEQMEVEYFIKSADWEKYFEEWRKIMQDYASKLGLNTVHELDIPEADRAHYSKRTIDFEFDYPFGRRELWGLAYRTDFDLKAHTSSSGVDLSYFDEESGERFIPHVIEPSLGVDRTLLALLVSSYVEDNMGGEVRNYFKFPKEVAPIRAAVFPLLKNKPELVAKAREVYMMLKKEIPNIIFDDNGNIGKRYRRQDEIGTPACITIDFGTLGDLSKNSGQEIQELLDTVTLRDRDTGEQQRVAIKDLRELLK